MASGGASITQLANTLSARSKTLINTHLKKICKEEGQIVSGNKPQLQARVLARTLHARPIPCAVVDGDMAKLQRLRYRLQNEGNAPPPALNTPPQPGLSSPISSSNFPNMANGQAGYANRASYTPYQQPQPRELQHKSPSISPFRESPFYEIREMFMKDMILEVSPSHRQSLNRNIILQPEMCARLRGDSTLRLLLFSAVEQPLGQFNQLLDIAFPSQVEVRINGDEVKANYKGLKNKPGSTRPADITEYVRKTAHYRNTLSMTYALTQKKYNVFIYLVKKHSVDDLAQRITQRNVITKQTVINEMLKKANDPDIEVSATNMSLKDPISTLRITVPCRSSLCNHNQCFDAASFLQLQEQAPTWQCPVCNKTVSFEGLAVDQYVQQILDSVPKGTDQVTIEPNGEWTYGNKADNQSHRNGSNSNHGDESDDDLVEIPDYRVSAIKSEAVHTPLSMTRTPPLSSREASTAPRTGQKRKSEVIDLTLSDEEEAPRPAKKVAYHTPTSNPDHSRRPQLPSFGSMSASSRAMSVSSRSQAPAQDYNSVPAGVLPIPTRSPNFLQNSGPYHQPPPRYGYPGQGSGSYPTYGNTP
ncbi:PINIT domain-domain-containing protein [Clohesyomyces aquaticus]|uniref:PINIT domain-domain-containing protein n=1 Tax=Clohesyomyces aquaticus TaxID=1231657 RepID=A0A1Y2A596_9PLEO|nr:PINIT domain-domain-containing protein [Clohesyomyces aquaticus]